MVEVRLSLENRASKTYKYIVDENLSVDQINIIGKHLESQITLHPVPLFVLVSILKGKLDTFNTNKDHDRTLLLNADTAVSIIPQEQQREFPPPPPTQTLNQQIKTIWPGPKHQE